MLIAPGVSPGKQYENEFKSPEGANGKSPKERTHVSLCRPLRGLNHLFGLDDPGLTPMATNIPPASQAR